jgi:signal transduction histidine kinase
MKIRTRAFLLGLLPTLLVALVLTAFHVYTRLNDLETSMKQQGMALARHLASSSEYGVLSGNMEALGVLLDQAVQEPGVRSAVVVWPDQSRLARGEPAAILPLRKPGQWQDGQRSWFAHPVKPNPLNEGDLFIDASAASDEPLAWVAISIDLQQKQALVRELLLASLSITILGVALAMLLIQQLALTGVQPLLDIIDTVKRISSGSFGSRMDVTAHSPELRELQAMVNQMSESLRSYQQDMEARVELVTAELEYKKKEAEQANLVKSKFLAAASHDLRQPMHAISLYVESLKSQMRDHTAVETLVKIERSILNMVELFNAILDVSKLDAGVVQPRLAPVRIRKFFLHLADEFAAEADKKGLSLRVHAPDVWIESDEILLERIFRNLLSNALRHTHTGGILLSARPYKGQLRLQIWDTGVGIAPEHQPRVFEEFYQAGKQEARARQGLGLGLAIVQRLTRLLGYPLQLHSVPGQGTVFAVDVPALPNAAIPDSGEAGESGGAPLTGLAVVVDDETAILDALGVLLRQWGMETKLLRNVDEVRQLLLPPDVVLADYQLLDGETGLMVAEEIHKRWGTQVPVVLITGDTRAGTVQMLDSLGHHVMYKPIQPARLRSLLQNILADKA